MALALAPDLSFPLGEEFAFSLGSQTSTFAAFRAAKGLSDRLSAT